MEGGTVAEFRKGRWGLIDGVIGDDRFGDDDIIITKEAIFGLVARPGINSHCEFDGKKGSGDVFVRSSRGRFVAARKGEVGVVGENRIIMSTITLIRSGTIPCELLCRYHDRGCSSLPLLFLLTTTTRHATANMSFDVHDRRVSRRRRGKRSREGGNRGDRGESDGRGVTMVMERWKGWCVEVERFGRGDRHNG